MVIKTERQKLSLFFFKEILKKGNARSQKHCDQLRMLTGRLKMAKESVNFNEAQYKLYK